MRYVLKDSFLEYDVNPFSRVRSLFAKLRSSQKEDSGLPLR